MVLGYFLTDDREEVGGRASAQEPWGATVAPSAQSSHASPGAHGWMCPVQPWVAADFWEWKQAS